MLEPKDLKNLCENDADFARAAALIWRLDLVWRGRHPGLYRIRDLDDTRRRHGQAWVKRGGQIFV